VRYVLPLAQILSDTVGQIGRKFLTLQRIRNSERIDRSGARSGIMAFESPSSAAPDALVLKSSFDAAPPVRLLSGAAAQARARRRGNRRVSLPGGGQADHPARWHRGDHGRRRAWTSPHRVSRVQF
jgi:hypothetical protein